jgi:hypothetical protein
MWGEWHNIDSGALLLQGNLATQIMIMENLILFATDACLFTVSTDAFCLLERNADGSQQLQEQF